MLAVILFRLFPVLFITYIILSLTLIHASRDESNVKAGLFHTRSLEPLGQRS